MTFKVQRSGITQSTNFYLFFALVFSVRYVDLATLHQLCCAFCVLLWLMIRTFARIHEIIVHSEFSSLLSFSSSSLFGRIQSNEEEKKVVSFLSIEWDKKIDVYSKETVLVAKVTCISRRNITKEANGGCYWECERAFWQTSESKFTYRLCGRTPFYVIVSIISTCA